MPRYRVEEKPKRSHKISVFSLIFPLISVLYAEGIFAFFSNSGLNVYKILFALAAGCLAVLFSRITPWRIVNYVLQTVWLLFCFGMITLQFLCFAAAGQYYSLFSAAGALPDTGAVFSAAGSHLPFLLCMAVPVVLQLAVQSTALIRRRSLLGTLLGSDWMEAFGMLVLALILAFVPVTMAFYDAEGDASPRRQLEIEYLPEASAGTFGVLPMTVLDMKYNLLGVAEEEVVHHYVITEDGQQVELTESEMETWLREG